MQLHYTEHLLKALEDAPPHVRKAFYKQARFLAENIHHPSLNAKKYDAPMNIWQARVTRSWRLYFTREGDTYILLDLIPHPK
jgi:mRNA-degrading endonuclease RelE of RelBE toxin-antitoxin system